MAKNITAKKDTYVSDVAPDYVQGDVGAGTEALSSEALRPPRIKLLQKVSPELDENEDLKPGIFYHDSAEFDLTKKVNIIPCFLTEAYFLFSPQQGGGLLARADDGIHWSPPDTDFEVQFSSKQGGGTTVWTTRKTVAQSGLSRWGTFKPGDPKSPPAATHAINCVVILPDYPDLGPAVLSFMRSGLKIGKKFASNLRMARAPSYGRVFTLTSQTVSGPDGDYLEPRVKPAGFVGDKSLYEAAKETYQAAKAQGVRVDVDMGESSDDDTGKDTAY